MTDAFALAEMALIMDSPFALMSWVCLSPNPGDHRA